MDPKEEALKKWTAEWKEYTDRLEPSFTPEEIQSAIDTGVDPELINNTIDLVNKKPLHSNPKTSLIDKYDSIFKGSTEGEDKHGTKKQL